MDAGLAVTALEQLAEDAVKDKPSPVNPSKPIPFDELVASVAALEARVAALEKQK